MKKLLFATILSAFAFALFGEEEYISPITGKPFKENGKFTLEQVKARDERVMKETGGFLIKEAKGPRALLIDSREKAKAGIDEVARLYKLGTKLDIDVEKTPRGNVCPLKFAQDKMVEKKPLLVVVVIGGDDKLPALSVFPEERIGLVNADKLNGKTDDPTVPEMRVEKEVWRAIGFIGGIGFSSVENDMMQPYYSVEELDKNIQAYIQPMNMAKMNKMFQRFGVEKERRIPYRVACQEGWAPAPTNEFQKAVWDKVHAVPSDPIKINFDPKTDKE